MNIAIVEDMDSDFFILKNMLMDNRFYNKSDMTISHYKTGNDFLAHFHPDKYQLLFLDILLDDSQTGMDIARAVRKTAKNLPIVFTTREREYALEGYEVQAFDYLLKPFSAERIDALLQRLFSGRRLKSYVTIQVDRENIRFPLDELMWVSTNNHVIELHLCDCRFYRTYMKFQDFCNMLPANADFYCCSRGILVNMKYVDYIENGDFVLTNGKPLPISRSKKNEMQMYFNEYQIKITRGEISC